LAGLATTAHAQGMFYREFQKDGRIYVFNIKANADRFAAAGETGVGITRLSYGPNAETCYFDNEQAMDLFNFKHGIAEVVERPKPPTQTLLWRDGKTRITTDNAYLEVSNRIQGRWTEELPDDSVQLGGAGAPGGARGSFRIRRAKLKLEGWFYRPWLQYETQLNWPDVTGSPASRFLEDANINWDVTKGRKRLMVRFGQFKVPFGHQELTSSGSQQFVDRSDVSLRYARGRETGVALWGVLGTGNKLEWRVGAFNGNGRSQATNDNDRYQFNARVVWQPNGAVPLGLWNSGALYSEGDFESTDKPIFALAANFESNDKFRATSSVDTKDTIWSGDAIFKYRRFSAVAEYYYKDAEPETGSSFTDRGFYVQASYLLDRKRTWELAARYGQIDPSSLKSGDDRREIGGALSYYYSRHNLKVQADVRHVEDDAANAGRGTKSQEIRLQTQLVF
jgi:phosphate-selective porin OprO/OprP